MEAVLVSYAVLPDSVMEAWPRLSPAACKVVGAVASFMNGEATKCFPSIKSIMARSGYKDDRSMRRALRELESRGILTIARRPGRSSLYSWASPKRRNPTAVSVPTKSTTPGEICRDTPHISDPGLPTFQTPHKETSKGTTEGEGVAVPPELEGFQLYKADANLCRRWSELLPAWEQAHPDLDIPSEIAKAHAWEVSNPSKRKKDKPRFINTWLNGARPAKGEVRKSYIDQEAERIEREEEKAALRYEASGFEDRLYDQQQKAAGGAQ